MLPPGSSASDEDSAGGSFGIPEISMLGFVVEDVEAAMSTYRQRYGWGPWRVFRFEPPHHTHTAFRGEPHDFSMVCALADVDGTTVELVEPTAGTSVYTEHLEQHGPGFSFFACFAYEDPAGAVQAFEAAGTPTIQYGRFHDDVEYWYLDTRDEFGVLFETASNLDAMPQPDSRYPSE